MLEPPGGGLEQARVELPGLGLLNHDDSPGRGEGGKSAVGQVAVAGLVERVVAEEVGVGVPEREFECLDECALS